jgi:hypothetical protein
MPTYFELNNSNKDINICSIRAIYINTFLSIVMCIILIVIASFLVPLTKDANILIDDASDTLKDMDIIIPEVKHTLEMVYRLCEYDNFTKHYGFLCKI